MGDWVLWLLAIEAALVAALLTPLFVGASLLQQGRTERAIPWFRFLYALGRVIPFWRGFCALNLSSCYINLGDFVTARTLAEEALARFTRRREKSYIGLAHAQVALVLTRLGEFEEAGVHVEEALAARSNRRYRRSIELYAAAYYINVGRFDDAMRLFEGVLSSAKPGTDMHYLAECNLSLCYYYRGELPRAIDTVRRAMKQKTSIPWLAGVALYDSMIYLAELGEIEEAEANAAKLIPLLPTLPPHALAGAYRAIGKLAFCQGDLDRARDYAARACAADANPNVQADALLIQAEVFAARHNKHRAETLCGEILHLNAMSFYKERAENLRGRLADRIQTAVQDATLPAADLEIRPYSAGA